LAAEPLLAWPCAWITITPAPSAVLSQPSLLAALPQIPCAFKRRAALAAAGSPQQQRKRRHFFVSWACTLKRVHTPLPAGGCLPGWLAGWLARRASALTSGCLHEYYLLATCLYGLFAAYSAPPALCFQPATVRGPPPPDPTSQFVGCAVSQPIAAHPFPCAVVFVLYPHCRSPESESAPPKHAARRSCTHAPPSQRSRPSCSAPSRIPLVLRAHAASML